MKRWNISHVIYYSNHGKNRIIEFNTNDVTIITGASRTGKTYILETIDYCLCSSNIDLSTFVKERISYVAIKIITNSDEIFVIREISNSKKTSGNTYIEIDNKIEIPINKSEFKGKVSVDDAKKFLTDKIGIIKFEDFRAQDITNIESLSIRQTTPYIYLDKETIDSKKHLLYGLDDANSAKYIIPSIPYFLDAIDIDELNAIKKLKSLKKAIETEEIKKNVILNTDNINYDNALKLYQECKLLGLVPSNIDDDLSYKMIISKLKQIAIEKIDELPYLNNNQLNNLYSLKTEKLNLLNDYKGKKGNVIDRKVLNESYNRLNNLQLKKLNILSLFKTSSNNCPICDSYLSESIEQVNRIEESIKSLSGDNKDIENHNPKLDSYILTLEKNIKLLGDEIRGITNQIENIIKQSESIKLQNDINFSKSILIGRISYFLDNIIDSQYFNEEKLDEYKEEYDYLKNLYDSENRKRKIEEAETFISNNTTKNLEKLPLDENYKDWSLKFISKKPTIELSNNEDIKIEKFASIGSDENYLCIHLALIFALHKFFSIKNSPVPGFIILDQVSRPYYPKNQDNDIIDEDNETLDQIFNFIFDQVAIISGLQVIIFEHAYLKNNERYKTATKYQWPRSGNERLIPNEWPKI